MSEEKKKFKNLFTYTLCLILAVIILILFAAMADSRENQFELEIDEKEKINMNIQNQIVSLTDENYKLKQENEDIKNQLSQKEESLTLLKGINHAWTCFYENKKEDGREILESIKNLPMTEEEEQAYQRLQQILK